MLKLAEEILKQVNTKSKIIYRKLPSDDPKQRQLDIALARKHLEWEPKMSLEEGLAETIKYFERQLGR